MITRSLDSKPKCLLSEFISFTDPINMFLKKANAFLELFSIKRLKMGSIVNLLDKLKMDESKKKMNKVITSIKVCSFNPQCFLTRYNRIFKSYIGLELHWI